MIFDVKITKHITYDSIIAIVNNDSFESCLGDVMDDSHISYGDNANTFVTIDDFTVMLHDALDEMDSDGDNVKELVYQIINDLTAMPKDVYISMGK